MPETNDDQRLNPQITTVEIGRRYLRTIEILPVALVDEKKLVEKVATVIAAFAQQEKGESETLEVAAFITSFVTTNIEEVLGYITEGEDVQELMKDITNEQVIEIGQFVYEINFEGLVSLGQDLLRRKKAAEESQTRGSSQQLSNDTEEDTASNISIDLDSPEED